jgi:hypothetical protein
MTRLFLLRLSERFFPASRCAKRLSKYILKFCGCKLLRWWAQCNVYLLVSFIFPALEFKTLMLVMMSSKKKLWQTFVMPVFLQIYRSVWNTSWAWDKSGVVASKCSQNHFISEKYKTVQWFKLHPFQNCSLVHLYASARDCKAIGNIRGSCFMKAFSVLPSHS